MILVRVLNAFMFVYSNRFSSVETWLLLDCAFESGRYQESPNSTSASKWIVLSHDIIKTVWRSLNSGIFIWQDTEKAHKAMSRAYAYTFADVH